uniref:3-phosphoinositide-dependent protein kinase 1 n=1 Tax=Panagrellus redivivus TaxID=6233 RepID=A0A7E4W0N5_PANRE
MCFSCFNFRKFRKLHGMSLPATGTISEPALNKAAAADDEYGDTPNGSEPGSFCGDDLIGSPRDSLASIPQVSYSSLFSLDDFESDRPRSKSDGGSSGKQSPIEIIDEASTNDPDEILKNRTHREIVTEARQKLSRHVNNNNANDYYFMKILGEGSFSTVFLCHEIPSNGMYAVKVMTKDTIRREKKLAHVMREKDIMASLTHNFGGHPFIIKLRCAFQDDRRLYFVIKVARYGELYDLLRELNTFDDYTTFFYASEIVAALNFIHRCRIVHRDLKPENILINDNWHILISDFGSAKIVGNKEQEALESEEYETRKAQIQSRGSFVGTAQYAAPEVLSSKCASYEADFWALGAIVYQMLAGCAPFRAPNEYHIMRRVMNLEYEMPENFSPVTKDLIQKLLVIDPMKRLGSLEMGGTLAVRDHPYFNDVDWENIAYRRTPDLMSLLHPEFEAQHTFPPVRPDVMYPGLDERAMTRMVGLGRFSSAGSAEGYYQMNTPSPDTDNQKGSFGKEKPALSSDEILQLKLAKQKNDNPFHQFVMNNLIVKQGFVDKRKGLFARRRMFLLTEGPHLFYVDPVSMELRGEVPFSKEMSAEARNFRSFFVHTPGRSYVLFDPQRNASAWCQAINEVRDRYMDELPSYPPLNLNDKASCAANGKSSGMKRFGRNK